MARVKEVAGKPKNESAKGELAMLEAALYVAGRPLKLKTLGYVIGTRSKRRAQQLARALLEEYKRRDTALEVLELEDHRFVLQLKTEYSSKVRRLAARPLLTDGPLRTLAYIAYRQPVMQKHVIDVRGSHAYRQIKQLVDVGLVDYERKGRNKVLRASEYFADYFGLSHNLPAMRRQLRRILDGITKGDTLVSGGAGQLEE
jgi:segregation and condensation protein B